MALFTVESARQAGLKSVQIMRQRKLERASLPLPTLAPTPEEPDPFARTLGEACAETLERLRKATKPIERAQLARALRDLRETWHLATGKARPGITRGDQPARTRTPMPRVYPAVYAGEPAKESPLP